MFEKFGEFDSYGEINELAENLLNEGDTESLKVMAKENGIQSELAEINAKARQEGMSYGQYVGLMYCEERDEMERRRRYDRKRRERFG